MAPRLTVIVPLRGRNLFTLRMLYHANRLAMPYRFIVADGLVHPVLAEILEDPGKHFPNLDIEYIRYPDDQDFSYFFKKVADAVSRAETPYAMLADNDDFLAPAGVERALNFLDAELDFVACSGRVVGFSIYSGLDNPTDGLRGRINSLYMYYALEDAAQETVTERLQARGLVLWPFYAITRKHVLVDVCREAAEISFSDLQLHETFHVMRVLTQGKARMDPTMITYVRQFGTSLNASFKKDWIHHIVRSRFTVDIDRLVEAVSSASVAKGADRRTIGNLVDEMLERKFRQIVKATYGSLQEVKHVLRRRVPQAVQWYKNRPRFGIRRERAAVIQELSAAGATPAYIGALQRELSVLEDVLSGSGFEHFAEHYVSIFAEGDAAHRKASNLH